MRAGPPAPDLYTQGMSEKMAALEQSRRAANLPKAKQGFPKKKPRRMSAMHYASSIGRRLSTSFVNPYDSQDVLGNPEHKSLEQLKFEERRKIEDAMNFEKHVHQDAEKMVQVNKNQKAIPKRSSRRMSNVAAAWNPFSWGGGESEAKSPSQSGETNLFSSSPNVPAKQSQVHFDSFNKSKSH